MSHQDDCYDIEQAIYQLFTGAGRKFDVVDLGRFSASLRPGMNVAVISGDDELITTAKYKESVSIILLITVQSISSEMQRRRLVHPLRLYVVRTLVGQKLTLKDESGATRTLNTYQITPNGWTERTSQEQFEKGQLVLEVRFKTAFEFPAYPPEEGADQELESILSSFHLVQADGTLTTDPVAQDDVKRDS